MNSKPLNDEERQELNFLREENLAQKQEIEKLKALLESKQIKQGPLGESCSELEKRLDSLREKIKGHRLEAEGKCWFFGIGGLDTDYGSCWDCTSYWYVLIHSSAGSCLANMGYHKLKSPCQDCKKIIEEMNVIWESWKSLKKIEKEA